MPRKTAAGNADDVNHAKDEIGNGNPEMLSMTHRVYDADKHEDHEWVLRLKPSESHRNDIPYAPVKRPCHTPFVIEDERVHKRSENKPRPHGHDEDGEKHGAGLLRQRMRANMHGTVMRPQTVHAVGREEDDAEENGTRLCNGEHKGARGERRRYPTALSM